MDAFDLAGFWRENAECFAPFSVNKPRAPLQLMLDDHFLLSLLPSESPERYYSDPGYALAAHGRANDLLERELGRRFYGEGEHAFLKGAFEILLGARRVIRKGGTPWIEPAVRDARGARLLADSLERRGLRGRLPEEWLEAKARLMASSGKRLCFHHAPNGPATVACHLLGTENLCLLIMEEPEMMEAFFEVLGRRHVEFIEAALLEDLGFVPREGVYINDDNCYLFPPDQYERMCAPYLKRLFDAFAPSPNHIRSQHSDSSMGHLMEILNRLGVNMVNFGPDMEPAAIRRAMPRAILCGQMPPFLLRDGSEEEIRDRVRREFEAVGQDGGWVAAPAGVVPESTPLWRIRAYMRAVFELTRHGQK